AEAAAHPNSMPTMVADTAPEATEKLAERFDARQAADWQQIVAASDVDVVIVATPNKYLAEIASAALTAGKHALIEKPMGRNLEEALSLAADARRSGKLLKVGFNHRYHPALRRAHELFAGGAIGKLLNLRV